MVGRRRNQQDERLPKYVYLKKNRYVYVQHLGRGQLGKELVLCPGDASLRQIWEAYEAATAKEPMTLCWLCNKYLESPIHLQKHPATRKDYERSHKQVISARLKDGRVFGDVRIAQVTPAVVLAYKDTRSSSAPIRTNRELAYLSVVFSWAYERDLVKSNPVKGVRRNKERRRERYVEDWEYGFVFGLADNVHYLRPAMEFAYLMRLRKVEVMSLSKQDLTEEGIRARRRKGSRPQIIEWSERLNRAVELCNTLTTVASLYIIHDDHGQPIVESTFDSAWQRLMVKASHLGLKERFTFHDLKAKGVSDFEGDKQRAAGHRTARMADVYDRKVERIKPTR